VSSKAEKLVARALGLVLARNVATGRSAEFPDLLLETAAELVAMQKRLKRNARMLRRAQKQIREAQLQIAAEALSRTGSPGDIERELRSLDMALGPPSWHPENRQNDDF
jgi:hypothetical protein